MMYNDLSAIHRFSSPEVLPYFASLICIYLLAIFISRDNARRETGLKCYKTNRKHRPINRVFVSYVIFPRVRNSKGD